MTISGSAMTPISKENIYFDIEDCNKVTQYIVSYRGEIGTTPERLVRPIVGLMPTTELELEGQIIEPSVSDPNDTATKFAATDIADPLLDPHGSADRT